MTMMPFSGRTGRGRTVAVLCVTSVALLGAACGDGANGGPEPTSEAMPESVGPLPAVSILEPADGAELPAGNVRVVLGAENVTIVPAGDTTPNSAHHHLLLNVSPPPDGEPIPIDLPGYVHLGQAQTEYTFEDLAPGDYTVTAVLGDFAHRVIPQSTSSVRFTVLPPSQ